MSYNQNDSRLLVNNIRGAHPTSECFQIRLNCLFGCVKGTMVVQTFLGGFFDSSETFTLIYDGVRYGSRVREHRIAVLSFDQKILGGVCLNTELFRRFFFFSNRNVLVTKSKKKYPNGTALQTFLTFLELQKFLGNIYLFVRTVISPKKVVLVPMSTYSTFSNFFRMVHQPLKAITDQGRNTATCHAARKKASPGVKVLTQILLQWHSRRPKKGR